MPGVWRCVPGVHYREVTRRRVRWFISPLRGFVRVLDLACGPA